MNESKGSSQEAKAEEFDKSSFLKQGPYYNICLNSVIHELGQCYISRTRHSR